MIWKARERKMDRKRAKARERGEGATEGEKEIKREGGKLEREVCY